MDANARDAEMMRLPPDADVPRGDPGGRRRRRGRDEPGTREAGADAMAGDAMANDGIPRGDMPLGEMTGAGIDSGMTAGGAMPGETMTSGTLLGEMPAGEMLDPMGPNMAVGSAGRMVGMMGGSEMPVGHMTGTDATESGTFEDMPVGAMTNEPLSGEQYAAISGPGADGMPLGRMSAAGTAAAAQTETERAVAAALAGGLTIAGDWQLTLSTISIGRGG